MQIYLVGGAVRDQLLGIAVQDQDFVVVGASPDEMLAAGYKPVGKDFPVFLHPHTHEEYALARTERKTAAGYHGFVIHAAPDVTLDEDLARRDLTINAIAQDAAGNYIDPYGGIADLRAGILRHVSPAFREDPVRLLRLARFAARYPHFSIAPETQVFLQEMVRAGEVDALVAERIWQELAKGLQEKQPARLFQVLRDCGALARILPELDALFGVPQPPQYHPEIDCGIHALLALNYAASQNYSLATRFAALMHDLGKAVTPAADLPSHHGHEALGVPLVQQLCQRLRVPSAIREVAVLTTAYHGDIHKSAHLNDKTIAKRLQTLDPIRKPERFLHILQACLCDARGRTGLEDCAYPAFDFWQHMARAYASVDGGAIARACANPAQIPDALHKARLLAIADARVALQPELP